MARIPETPGYVNVAPLGSARDDWARLFGSNGVGARAIAAGKALFLLPGVYYCKSSHAIPAGLVVKGAPGVLVDDSASPGQASAAFVRAATGRPLVVKAQTDRAKIMIVGDSNTTGSDYLEGGFVGSWRDVLYERMRLTRSDFDFVGPNVTVPEEHPAALWFHAAQAGSAIETHSALIDDYVAAVGEPDVFVDMLGTNNISSGDSLATMQAKRLALNAAYTANAPGASVLALSIPPFVAGVTVAGNLAAWNTKRTQYNDWLKSIMTSATHRFLDVGSTLGNADYQADGVHLNRMGAGKIGDVLASFLASDAGLGAPSGYVLPRRFRMRMPQKSIACAVSGVDGMTCTGHAGYNPGSGSYAIAFDFYCDDVSDSGNLRTVIQYGTYAASDYWAIFEKGRRLHVYWNTSNVGAIVDAASGLAVSDIAIKVNTWNRIVLMAHAASGTVGLYVNGELVGLTTGLGAWAFTQKVLYVSKNPEFGGATGYFSRIHAYKGSAVPKPGTMAAQLAVEADYYDEQSICAGSSACHNLHTTLADTINGNPAMVLVGGAAAKTAFPGQTPGRPWEWGA